MKKLRLRETPREAEFLDEMQSLRTAAQAVLYCLIKVEPLPAFSALSTQIRP